MHTTFGFGMRSLRFSVKTLLLFIIGVCAAIGWLAWNLRKATDQRLTVERIRESAASAGALVSVYYDYERDETGALIHNPRLPAPEWLVRLLGIDFLARPISAGCASHDEGVRNEDVRAFAKLTSLRNLVLISPQLTDSALDHIASLTDLRSLGLSRTRISDAGLRSLRNLNRLKGLNLSRTSIRGWGLRYLVDLPLEGLVLSNTSIASGAGRYIGKMHELEVLDLSYTQFGDAGVHELKGLARLLSLNLSFCPVTDEALKTLSEMGTLRHLLLAETKVTDVGIKLLEKMKQLKTLGIDGPDVSIEGRNWLRAALPGVIIDPYDE